MIRFVKCGNDSCLSSALIRKTGTRILDSQECDGSSNCSRFGNGECRRWYCNVYNPSTWIVPQKCALVLAIHRRFRRTLGIWSCGSSMVDLSH